MDREGNYRQTHVGVWSTYCFMNRAGIRVSIDGRGSDELLGGYRFCGESLLEAAEGSFELRRALDLRRVLARLNGDAAPLRLDAKACCFARRQLRARICLNHCAP